MEVLLLPNNSLRIKGKKATIIVDPKKDIPKQIGDAILLLQRGEFDPTRVSEYRIIVSDPGEYEIGGIKMIAVSGDNERFYSLNVDNLDMVLANTSSLSKFKDAVAEPKIAILNADSEVDPEAITAIEPRVVVLYGAYSQSTVRALGKEGVSGVKKYAATKETSLLQETEVVWLV